MGTTNFSANKFRIKSLPATCNIVLIAILMLTLNACAGRVTKPVNESARDTTGQYDGRWIGKVVFTSPQQRSGNWRLSCSDPTDEFAILVKNGQVSTRIGKDTKVAYIDSKGRFRISIPSTVRASESVSSEVSLNSDITYFLEGILAPEKSIGTFVVGIAQFGNNGCRSSIEYEKI